jgi:hypothetical protein
MQEKQYAPKEQQQTSQKLNRTLGWTKPMEEPSRVTSLHRNNKHKPSPVIYNRNRDPTSLRFDKDSPL